MKPDTEERRDRVAALGLGGAILGVIARAGEPPGSERAIKLARVAICFDEGRPLRRRAMFAPYQTGRERDPKFIANEPTILRAIAGFSANAAASLPVVSRPRHEHGGGRPDRGARAGEPARTEAHCLDRPRLPAARRRDNVDLLAGQEGGDRRSGLRRGRAAEGLRAHVQARAVPGLSRTDRRPVRRPAGRAGHRTGHGGGDARRRAARLVLRRSFGGEGGGRTQERTRRDARSPTAPRARSSTATAH